MKKDPILKLGPGCPRALSLGLFMIWPMSSYASDLERLGDALQVLNPVYGLYASYQMNGREGAWACAKAVGLTAVSSHALKAVVNAPRPNGGDKGFPSAHTSSAAVGFGCVLGQDGWSPTSIALGVTSLVTGYSRVQSDNHTWGQVSAGFLLGTAVGYYMTRHLGENARIEYNLSSQGYHAVSYRLDF